MSSSPTGQEMFSGRAECTTCHISSRFFLADFPSCILIKLNSRQNLDFGFSADSKIRLKMRQVQPLNHHQTVSHYPCYTHSDEHGCILVSIYLLCHTATVHCTLLRTSQISSQNVVCLLNRVPEAVATQEGGRFLFFLRRCCNCAVGPACEEPSRLLLTLLRGCGW